MGLFNFFKKNKSTDKVVEPIDYEDRSSWIGKDFEFLITGDINIPAEDYDRIMTPNTFEWRKVKKGN